MKKKLPSLYKGNDYAHINNNRCVFRSNEFGTVDSTSDTKRIDLESVYLINTPVVIETMDNKVIKTKIVGKLSDHILTSNNEIIELVNIKSIKKEKPL